MEYFLLAVIVGITVLAVLKTNKRRKPDSVTPPSITPIPTPPEGTGTVYFWSYNDDNVNQDSLCGEGNERFPQCREGLEYPTAVCDKSKVGEKIELETCCIEDGISANPYWECVEK